MFLNRIPHLAGAETYDEGLELFNIDIETAPLMDRQLLIFHSGKDRLIPDGKEQRIIS